MVPDELLDDLGNYFVEFYVRERFGITFESFVERYMRGTWRRSNVLIPLEGVNGV